MRIWPLDSPASPTSEMVLEDLKQSLSGLVEHLFGKGIQMRWLPDSFPFTDPSIQLEVLYNEKWLEILGSGVIAKEILENVANDLNTNAGYAKGTKWIGWAFGVGLERLAMALCNIPDIRLFWSEDPRFSSQFNQVQVTTSTHC